MNFSVRIGDLQLRSCAAQVALAGPHDRAEIVQWGAESCWTVAYWERHGPEIQRSLRYVGTRPLEGGVDRDVFDRLVRLGYYLLHEQGGAKRMKKNADQNGAPAPPSAVRRWFQKHPRHAEIVDDPCPKCGEQGKEWTLVSVAWNVCADCFKQALRPMTEATYAEPELLKSFRNIDAKRKGES